MAYSDELIRIYTFSGVTPVKTDWLIWPEESTHVAQTLIPDFSTAGYFIAGSVAVFNTELYEALESVFPGDRNEAHWELIEPKIGFVVNFDTTVAHEAGHVIIEDDVYYTAGRATSTGAFTAADWTALASGDTIEDALIYVGTTDDYSEKESVTGTFQVIGGDAVTEDVAGAETAIGIYFEAGKSGAWYRPRLLVGLYQDSTALIPVTTPGQHVGYMHDHSGNGYHAKQATGVNRPIYRVDGNGLGYLEFSDNSYLSVVISAANARLVMSVPSIGQFALTGVNAPGIYELGPSVRFDDKVWYMGEGALLIDALSTDEITEVTDQLTVQAAGYEIATVTSLKEYWREEITFNGDVSNWTTEYVTDMSGVFRDAVVFNQSIDDWNTARVLTMANMFEGATVYDKAMPNVVTAACTSFKGMFKNAVAFDQEVNSWSTVANTDLSEMFSGATAFNKPISTWNTALVTDMAYMFNNATSFTQAVVSLVTTQVTDISYMFNGCTGFNSSVAGWDLTSLTKMASVFNGCTIFAQDVSSWVFVLVTDMSYAFADCTAFDGGTGTGVSGWDVSTVSNFEGVFMNAVAFTDDLQNWNVGLAENMNYMFSGATVFNQDITGWDVSNCELFDQMFYIAAAFDKDLSNWCVETVDVTPISFSTGSAMVAASVPIWGLPCIATEIDGWYNFSDTGSLWQDDGMTVPVTDPGQFIAVAEDMTGNNLHARQTDSALRPVYREDENNVGYAEFANPSYLSIGINSASITLIDCIPGIGAETRLGLASQAGSFRLGTTTHADAQDHEVAEKVWYMGQAIVKNGTLGATSLASAVALMADKTNNYAEGTITSLVAYYHGDATFSIDTANWNLTGVTDLSRTFKRTPDFNQDLSTLSFTDVTLMTGMFNEAGAFNQDITGWDTSNVTNMFGMFFKAAVFNTSVTGLNTSEVTNTAYMFSRAPVFNQSVVSFDNSKLESTVGMFESSPAFNQPMIGFDVSNVTNMTEMFKATTIFNQDLTGWDTSKVSKMDAMFENAVAFNKSIAHFSLVSTDSMTAMFAGTTAYNTSLDGLDTSGITDMSRLFASTTVFDTEITALDFSAVENFTSMFESAAAFNKPLNALVTTGATNFETMFKGATLFNQPLTDWDVSEVDNMVGMFNNAAAFNQDLTGWCVEHIATEPSLFDTGGVLQATFAPLWGVKCLPVDAIAWYDFSTTATMFTDLAGTTPVSADGDRIALVTDLTSNNNDINQTAPLDRPVFRLDSANRGYISFTENQHLNLTLTSATISQAENIPGVGSYIFTAQSDTAGVYRIGPKSPLVGDVNGETKTWNVGVSVLFATTLSTRDTESIQEYLKETADFYVAGTITDFSNYFRAETSFNSIISDWNTIGATDMHGMFNGATAFSQDVSALETSLVTDLSFMFNGASAFDGVIQYFDTSEVTNMASMFNGAVSFTQAMSFLNVEKVLDMSNMFNGAVKFNQNLTDWNSFLVTNVQGMFNGAVKFNGTLDSFLTPEVTDMSFMLTNAAAFNRTVDTFDTGKVTTMESLFDGASAFNQDVSTWTTDGVLSMKRMFANTQAFNGDVSGWDVSNVTAMESMFLNALVFEGDLSGWITTSLATVSAIFKGAAKFNSDVTDWDLTGVTILDEMFRGAVEFNQNINLMNVEDVTSMKSMFRDTVKFNKPLESWDVSDVVSGGMDNMFNGSTIFNQNLSSWCVSAILTEPAGFSVNSNLETGNKPGWGLDCYGGTIVALYDPTVIGSMYSDIGALNVITGAGQTVALIKDLTSHDYDAKQTDAALRPVYRVDTAGKGYLEFPAGGFMVTGIVDGEVNLYETIPSVGLLIHDKETVTTGLNIGSIGDVGSIHYLGRTVVLAGDLTTTQVSTSTALYSGHAGEYANGTVTVLTDYFIGYDKVPELVAWTTGQITRMDGLFQDCAQFNQDLSGWNTGAVTNTSDMFNGCSAFNPDLSSWDVGSLIHAERMFRNCPLFDSVLSAWTFTALTNTAGMFQGCTAFNQDLDDWDVSSVTTMKGMFRNCTSFNGTFANWDTDALLDISYMFDGCELFASPVTHFDTQNCTTMSGTFKGCSVFNSTLAGWDTVNVESMSDMFNGCTDFTRPVSGFTTDSVTTMARMFQDCTSYITGMGVWDTTSLLDVTDMFKGAILYNEDIADLDVSAILLFAGMLNGCNSFVLEISKWCVEHITTIPVDFHKDTLLGPFEIPRWGKVCLDFLSHGLYDASEESSVCTNLAGTVQVANVGDSVMFLRDLSGRGNHFTQSDVGALPIFRRDAAGKGYLEFPIGSALYSSQVIGEAHLSFNMPNVGNTIMDHVGVTEVVSFEAVAGVRYFSYGSILAEWASTTANLLSLATEMANKAADYAVGTVTNLDNFWNGESKDFTMVNWDVSGITSMVGMFRFTDEFNYQFVNWNTSAVTDMSYMFEGAVKFNSLLTGLQTGNVVNMTGMFKDSIFNQNMDTFDTSSVTNMREMFHDATSFNQEVDDWNVTSVTSMAGMFKGATGFTSPLTNWSTSALLNTSEMFSGCSSYNAAVVSMDMDQVTNSSKMFQGCSAFAQSVEGWTVNAIQNGSYMFDGCPLFTSTLDSWVLSGLQYGDYMFRDCSVFNSDISGFNLGNLVTAKFMFSGCSVFTGTEGADGVEDWSIGGIADMTGMFMDCTVFQGAVNTWTIGNVVLMKDMFNGCTAFNVDLGSWEPLLVTNFDRMFKDTTNYTRDLSDWCVVHVTTDPVNFETGSGMTAAQIPYWGAACVDFIGYAWYDFSVSGSLWQDIAKTVPAVLDGDRIAVAEDQILTDHDGVQTNAALRPTLRLDSDGRGYAEFAPGQGLVTTADTLYGTAWTEVGVGTTIAEANAFGTGNSGMFRATGLTGSYSVASVIITKASTINSEIFTELNPTVTAYHADAKTTTLGGYFEGILVAFEIGDDWDTTGVTDFSRMFKDTDAFTEAGTNFANWDTGSATTMERMFSGSDGIVAVGAAAWEVGNVTTMAHMFSSSDCSADLGVWDTGNCIDLSSMFSNANLMNFDINDWDVSQVTNMQFMFEDSSLFNSDLFGWDVSAVRDLLGGFDGMFDNATSMAADISMWCVEDVGTLPSPFASSSAILPGNYPNWGVACAPIAIFRFDRPETLFLDTGQATAVTTPGQRVAFAVDQSGNGNHIFQDVAALRPTYREDTSGRGYLEEAPGQALINVTATSADEVTGIVGTGSAIFENWTVTAADANEALAYSTGKTAGPNLNSSTVVRLPQGSVGANLGYAHTLERRSKRYTSDAITNYEGLFEGRAELTGVYGFELSVFTIRADITSLKDMFKDCPLFVRGVTGWDTATVTDMSGMFNGCTLFNQSIAHFNFEAVTTMESMLEDCSSFNQSFGSALNFGDLLTMENTFKGCTAFDGQVAGWTFPLCTNFEGTFRSCASFNQPLRDWVVDAALTTRLMLQGCTLFNSPLDLWTLEHNNDFSFMFEFCTSFNQDIGGWDVSEGDLFISMFHGATLMDQNLSSWCVEDITNAADHQDFGEDSGLPVANFPDWGTTCPAPAFFDFTNTAFMSTNADGSPGNVIGANTSIAYIRSTENATVSLSQSNSLMQPVYQVDSAGRGYLEIPVNGGFDTDFNGGYVLTGGFPGIGINTYSDKEYQAALPIAKVSSVGSVRMSSMSFVPSGRTAQLATVNLAVKAHSDLYAAGTITSMSSYFRSSGIVGDDALDWDLSSVTDLSWLFYLTDVTADLSVWNNSLGAVTTMEGMFRSSDCSSTNISDWVVDSVTDMSTMFMNSETFNQNITGWNVSNVTTMHSMFEGTTVFDQPLGLWGELTSLVSMQDMFKDTFAFNGSLSGWTFVEDVNAHGVFEGADSFVGDIHGWDVTTFIDVSNMFADTILFDSDLGDWELTKCTTLTEMFKNAKLFNHSLTDWDTSLITDMRSVFEGTLLFDGSLTGWDTGAVTTMEKMFYGADEFDQPLSNWDVTNVTTAVSMFQDAVLFNKPLLNWSFSYSDAGDATLGVALTDMFKGCLLFSQPLDSWVTSGAINMHGMFTDAETFNGAVNGWDVSKVTDMSEMFWKCAMFNQNMSTWRPSRCLDMHSMFRECLVFNQNLYNWDTGQVREMAYMFFNCAQFNAGQGYNAAFSLDQADGTPWVYSRDMTNWWDLRNSNDQWQNTLATKFGEPTNFREGTRISMRCVPYFGYNFRNWIDFTSFVVDYNDNNGDFIDTTQEHRQWYNNQNNEVTD